jgi:DNA-directed RNA polymerase specialized sigma24 family protein
MEQEKVWREFVALPEEDQQRVADFIASLRGESRSALSDGPEKRTDLANEPFVGVWREREDMRDSSAWLREIREREWIRPRG